MLIVFILLLFDYEHRHFIHSMYTYYTYIDIVYFLLVLNVLT
jgi:hypothetical protein